MGCSEVNDHRAGFHLRYGIGAEQGRSLAARDQGGGDDDIGLFGAFVHGQGLALHPTGGHRACVAPDTDGAFTLFIGFVGNVDKLGAQGFDLLLNRRAYVGRFDHRAQALGRGDGLQARHTGAKDQYACGFYSAGSSHQHRHEARVVMSGQQHGLVTGDVGLRRQHIKALSA